MFPLSARASTFETAIRTGSCAVPTDPALVSKTIELAVIRDDSLARKISEALLMILILPPAWPVTVVIRFARVIVPPPPTPEPVERVISILAPPASSVVPGSMVIAARPGSRLLPIAAGSFATRVIDPLSEEILALIRIDRPA